MEIGLLRIIDIVSGDSLSSKCSSSASSDVHLLCSSILRVAGIGRFGGLRGTAATAVAERGPGSGSGGLANRSEPQSFNHGSMVT